MRRIPTIRPNMTFKFSLFSLYSIDKYVLVDYNINDILKLLYLDAFRAAAPPPPC